ncbi:MAG: LytTR family DNA-binding domain-containing protein [Lachnoclostridium sp.]|nr:LytTR family DNA-binding domain-containing protein [Lachnospira sp.]MCM1249010.1 LytTR family DNA-binding domain-containing protein [Lachnoclostridium sp.]
MKKILVLEDNPTTLMNLTQIVQNVDVKNIVYPFHDLKDAYQCAMEKEINLFIVDIILDRNNPGDSSGLKFVENIRKINHYAFVPIIFVTSLEDAQFYTYANLHCYSFVEKPFDAEQLRKLIAQCLRFGESVSTSKTLYFRKDGIILAAEREDIVYVESINHIIHIHTRQGDVLEIPYITLKKLLDDLDCLDFIQCSRNTIVNQKFIHNIDKTNGIIQLKNGMGRVDIGITFKSAIKGC